MSYWLFKEEPDHYSFADLERDGETVWSGVANALARSNLRKIKAGDRILYYHTGGEKAVVGMARAVGDAYDDPDDPSGRRAAVDIAPEGKLSRPVALAEIKSLKMFAKFPLVRISRLSVMPVKDQEWEAIVRMSGRSA